MKAALEAAGPQYRGITVTSEYPEEKETLQRIWNQRGACVAISKVDHDQVQLTIAPTPPNVLLHLFDKG